MSWRIIQGDCIKTMAAMAEASVDAIVTDPPYGLGFMGKEWDSSFQAADMAGRRNGAQDAVNVGAARQGGRQRQGTDYQRRMARDFRDFQEWCETWTREALRVLKPGGHLLAFGGTRTYHRLACAIEDAGFEIRDTIAWLYGSGFPKSHNLDGDWAGWGIALKPAHEPIVVARKPLSGTVAANVTQFGTGALNVDGCRIGTEQRLVMVRTDTIVGANSMSGESTGATSNGETTSLGRWPANVVLDEQAAAMLDAQTGTLHSQEPQTRNAGRKPGWSPSGTARPMLDKSNPNGGDSGGASRFMYVAKASSAERNAGLDGFAQAMPHDNAGHVHADGRAWDIPGSHSTARANHHPTVKPISLMRWLVRLVTPLGGTVLDPFAGSGTTGIAAVLEGFAFVGIEREAEYVAIAEARIAWWAKHPDGMTLVKRLEAEKTQAAVKTSGQGSIFDVDWDDAA